MLVAVPLACGGLVAALLGGSAALVWFVLGVTSGVQVAVTAVSWGVRAALLGLAALASAAGLLAAGSPWAAALVVLAAGLAQAPLSRASAAVGAMLPVLAAVGASAGLPDRVVPAVVWVVAGHVLVIALARILRVATPPRPVDGTLAVAHALVVGVGGAVAIGVSVSLDVGHGYWVVLTLAMVLRPSRTETRTVSRDRVLGTVGGVVLSVAVVLLLPTYVALAAGLVSALLMIAWALAGDVRRQTLYGAPVVVLAASSGFADRGVEVAGERLLLTVLGVLLAVGLAVLLRWWEQPVAEAVETSRPG